MIKEIIIEVFINLTLVLFMFSPCVIISAKKNKRSIKEELFYEEKVYVYAQFGDNWQE